MKDGLIEQLRKLIERLEAEDAQVFEANFTDDGTDREHPDGRNRSVNIRIRHNGGVV